MDAEVVDSTWASQSLPESCVKYRLSGSLADFIGQTWRWAQASECDFDFQRLLREKLFFTFIKKRVRVRIIVQFKIEVHKE